MKPIPQADDLTVAREWLLQRREVLRAEGRGAQALRRDALDAAPPDVEDRKDEAAERQTLATDDAQERRDRDEIDAIEAALGRLDAGRYGLCADCGEPIPRARLLAQPAALRCAACQGARERAPGAPARRH
jgi:DnaK suppressor protein